MKPVPKKLIQFINRQLCKFNIDLLLVPHTTYIDILFRPLEERMRRYHEKWKIEGGKNVRSKLKSRPGVV